jgi:hypothetical protein
MNRSLALSFLLGLLASSQLAQADETLARNEHKLQMAAAREQLLAAFDDEIEDAASRADLEGVRKIVQAKRAFRENGVLPAAEPLKEAVRAYVTERRRADGELISAWRAAIGEAKESGDAARTTTLEAELKAFVAGEEPFLAAATRVEREATRDEAISKKIIASLQGVIDVTSEYLPKLQKVKAEEPGVRSKEIIAKQLQEMRDGLNRKLKGERWTLHFPIKQVSEKPASRGQYLVAIEPPLETEEVNSEWDVASNWTITLSKERALRIKPGDTLKVTGVPQVVGPTIHRNGAFARRFSLNYSTELICVQLSNTKIEILPQAK